MKTYPSATAAYRSQGRKFLPVHFISIRAKDWNTPSNTTWFHFCTDDEDVSQQVVNPNTGATVTRTYLGGGHIVSLDDLSRSEGAVIYSHSLVLSGTSDTVRDMVLGHDCQDVHFEWHIGERNEDTGLLIDIPTCEFVGVINTIDPQDAALAVDGQEAADSHFVVVVNSLAATLTARNYDMRTKDVAANRSNDRFFDYVSNAKHWRVWWGKERKSEEERRGGGKDKGTRTDPGDHFGRHDR